PRHSDAAHRREIVLIRRTILAEQTISPAEAVHPKLPLEKTDAPFVFRLVAARRQQFQPYEIAFEPLEAEGPLQRDREVAAPFAIFRRKPAADEHRHAAQFD